MRNAGGHQWKVKISGSEKKWTEKRTTRVTKKLLEVSRSSRAEQRQRNVPKKCAARTRAKLLLLIRPIVVFQRFSALHAFAA